jgi:outer membrane protein assembly factor BamB
MAVRRGLVVGAVVATVAVVAVALVIRACTGPEPFQAAPAPGERTLTGSPTGSARPLGEGDWPTYHRDNSRSGAAVGFPALGQPRTAWRANLDGAVYGQPLVIGDTVYAATEHDTVYALAADSGAVRWSAHLGEPMPGRQLPCGNIDPLGITSTMVYDPGTDLVFALAETRGAHHTLFGLDAVTGEVRVSRAAEPPKGDPVAHQQRSALNLLGDRVYIAYGGLAGDCGRYIGSVVSIPTSGRGAAQSYAIPTTREAGIWTPAGGTVHNGRLLYASGNGESTSGYDGSDSVLALNPQLQLVDRFSPATWADDNAKDLDLGSMGAVVVNGYVVIAGKRGVVYTLRADRFGGIGGQVAQAETCEAYGGSAVDGDTVFLPCNDGPRAVQVDSAGRMSVRWHAAVPAAGSPVLGGGALWVVDYDGAVLYALDPATGAVREQVGIPGAPHFASPTLARGQVFVGTMTGVVAVHPH